MKLYSLPKLKLLITNLTDTLQQSFEQVRSRIGQIWPFSKYRLYQAVCLLDIILISIILINGIKPAQRLVAPYISSLQPIVKLGLTTEKFAFIPGSSINKYRYVQPKDLDYLAFFDLPIDDTGNIITSSRGFRNLTSGAANDLFRQSQSQGVKVLLTITQTNPQSIEKILTNSNYKNQLISQTINLIREQGLNGVVISFEDRLNNMSTQRENYSNLISDFRSKMNSELPNSTLAIAVPSNSQSLYDLEQLSKNSDKIFVLASDFAAPENKNDTPQTPKFGYDHNLYWNEVGHKISAILSKLSDSKIAIETAWYGDGDRYPLYTPDGTAEEFKVSSPATAINLTSNTLDRLIQGVPSKARPAARRNIPIIAKALEDEGILDSNVLAYALATIEHETAGTFEPIDEYHGRLSARRLGYEGGTNYFGRGFIQLTHLRNYKMIGKRIGLGDQLAQDPNLASKPEVAAKILAAFFRDNNVANLASKGRFVAARAPINPDANGYKVAMLASKYE